MVRCHLSEDQGWLFPSKYISLKVRGQITAVSVDLVEDLCVNQMFFLNILYITVGRKKTFFVF